MSRKYSIFLNGVFHGQVRGKGAALDKAYNVVDHLQRTFAGNAINYASRGYDASDVKASADKLSELLGVLASVIPTARRERDLTGRPLDVERFGTRISVRRDAA